MSHSFNNMDAFDPFGEAALAAPTPKTAPLESPVKPAMENTQGEESPSTASTSVGSRSPVSCEAENAVATEQEPSKQPAATENNPIEELMEVMKEWAAHTGSGEVMTLEKASTLMEYLVSENFQPELILFRKTEADNLVTEQYSSSKRKKQEEEQEQEEEAEAEAKEKGESDEEDDAEDLQHQAIRKEKESARRLQKVMKKVLKIMSKPKLNQAALSWCFLMVHDLFRHEDSSWDMLFEVNPTGAIVDILQDQNELNVHAPGVAAICSLVRNSRSVARYQDLLSVSKTGALEMINKAMKNFERNERIHINCGRALAKVSVQCGLVTHVKKLKLIDTAIRSLIDHRDVPDISGVDCALSNWASSDTEMCKKYKSHQVLPHTLERMLKFPNHLHLQRVGCHALYEAFRRISNMKDQSLRFKPRKELIEADAFDALYKAMANFPDEPRIHLLCMWAFYHAAKDSPQTAKMLHEMKGVEIVVDRIKFFPNEPGIIRACCLATRSLCINKDAKMEFKHRGAVALIEDAKRRFPDDAFLQMNANMALYKLKSSVQAMKQFVSRKFKQAVNAKYAQPLLVE